MDQDRFDQLTRAFGAGRSRRGILKGLGAAALGAVGLSRFGSTEAAKGGNSACAQFCASIFGADTPAAGQCTSEAAHGTGLCSLCGPASPAGAQSVCCATNDAGLCVSYGDVTCPDFQTDLTNCGGCGNVCPGPTSGTGTAICTTGECGISCSGSTPNVCGTSCSACCTSADCDSTQACYNGVCLARGGQPCTYGSDCFTQNCLLPSHTCAGVCAGNPCDVNADCTTGICGSDNLCQPNNGGGVCHCSQDCTTGNCVRDSNVYWGTCSTVGAGSSCAANADCTTRSCLNGVCQQSPGCGPCYHQEDCLGYGQVSGVFCHSSTTCYPCPG